MSEKIASHVVLTICAISIVTAGAWGIKEGLFYATAPALLAVLWEVRQVAVELPARARTAICVFITFLSVVLNAGFVSKAPWRAIVIACVFAGVLILAIRDLTAWKATQPSSTD